MIFISNIAISLSTVALFWSIALAINLVWCMQWVLGREHSTCWCWTSSIAEPHHQPFPVSYPSRRRLYYLSHTYNWLGAPSIPASDPNLSDGPDLHATQFPISELAQCHQPLLSFPPVVLSSAPNTEHRRPSLNLDFLCLVECKIEFSLVFSYSIFMVSSVTVISFMNLLNVMWCYMSVITALGDWSRKPTVRPCHRRWQNSMVENPGAAGYQEQNFSETRMDERC